jgi:hypothetical protein
VNPRGGGYGRNGGSGRVGVWDGGVRPEAVDQRGAGRAAPVGAARPLPRRRRGAPSRRGRARARQWRRPPPHPARLPRRVALPPSIRPPVPLSGACPMPSSVLIGSGSRYRA